MCASVYLTLKIFKLPKLAAFEWRSDLFVKNEIFLCVHEQKKQ